jgi:hypothetical protein
LQQQEFELWKTHCTINNNWLIFHSSIIWKTWNEECIHHIGYYRKMRKCHNEKRFFLYSTWKQYFINVNGPIIRKNRFISFCKRKNVCTLIHRRYTLKTYFFFGISWRRRKMCHLLFLFAVRNSIYELYI